MNTAAIIPLLKEYISQYPNEAFGHQTLDFVVQNEDFWSREHLEGHVTASVWVLNTDKTKALLTHHKALNLWCQLGGHIEAIDETLYDACYRELEEESGLKHHSLLSPKIFDIDIHKIPLSKKGIPEHYHYDIRLAIIADEMESIQYELEESNVVKWLDFEDIRTKSNEASVLRMIEKSLKI